MQIVPLADVFFMYLWGEVNARSSYSAILTASSYNWWAVPGANGVSAGEVPPKYGRGVVVGRVGSCTALPLGSDASQ